MRHSGNLRWVFIFYLVFAFYINLIFTIQVAHFEVPQQNQQVKKLAIIGKYLLKVAFTFIFIIIIKLLIFTLLLMF